MTAMNGAAGAPAFGGQSPFANAGKEKKSKMPILPSDEVWRQYQMKLESERMSDEEFSQLWRDLRQDAIESQRVAAEPYDLERAQEKAVRAADGVEPVEYDPIDPDFEYLTDDGGTIDGIDVIAAIEMEQEEHAAEAPEPDDEMPFEEAVEQLKLAVTRENRYREILFKTLKSCMTRKALPDVEDEIAAYPEYEYAAQNPYRLIRLLVDKKGLDLLEIDEEGSVVTPERKVGLTEDEIDDLIVEFQLETTVVGEQVVEELEPSRRLKDLLDEFPIRFESYKEVMEFCKTPHSMKEINKLFEGRDLKILGTMHSDKSIPIQPSVFVDKLEHAGILYWNGSWNLTLEGRLLLGTLSKA